MGVASALSVIDVGEHLLGQFGRVIPPRIRRNVAKDFLVAVFVVGLEHIRIANALALEERVGRKLLVEGVKFAVCMALKRLPIKSCEFPATLQALEYILLHTIAMEEDELHLHLVYARVLGASHVCLLVKNHCVDLFKHF